MTILPSGRKPSYAKNSKHSDTLYYSKFLVEYLVDQTYKSTVEEMRNSSGPHNLGPSSPPKALSTTGSFMWFFDTQWRGHYITKFYTSPQGLHTYQIHFIERIAL
jgi:hypothetical protein